MMVRSHSNHSAIHQNWDRTCVDDSFLLFDFLWFSLFCRLNLLHRFFFFGRLHLFRFLMWLEFLLHHHLIILLKVIVLDELYQGAGIHRRCSISCLFQTFCPTFIICDFQIEKRRITLAVFQKFWMVIIRFLGIFIHSKTFLRRIVILPHRLAFPVRMAFYSEMVVAFWRQFALSVSRFQNSLCQSYWSRDFILHHLGHGDIFVFVNIIKRFLLPLRVLGVRKKTADHQQQQYNISEFARHLWNKNV